jgi:hypothetical protein
MSETRDSFLLWLQHEHGFALEVPFRGESEKRRWRFDAAREDLLLAVEYQGIGAGHQWSKEQARDHEKYNEAVLLGWAVMLVSAESVNNGTAMGFIDRFMTRVSAEMPMARRECL